MDKIKFMDRFVKIYGIKSLADFDTKISTKQFVNDTKFLDKINTEIDKIKEYFSISQMSLAKNNYMVKTPLQAIQLLKHCLQQMNIGFQKLKINNTNYVRLISPNFLYIDYIKMISNSKIQELTPNNKSDCKKKSLELSKKWETFEDFYEDMNIKDINGTNMDCIKYIAKAANDGTENACARNEVNFDNFTISERFLIKDDGYHVLYKFNRESDIVESYSGILLDSDKTILQNKIKCSYLSGNFYINEPIPLVALAFDPIYACFKFSKDTNIHSIIKCSRKNVYLSSEPRYTLAAGGWKFKDRSYEVLGGKIVNGDKKFIEKAKGTETMGVKFKGLKGTVKFPNLYRQISNVKFRAVTPKDPLGRYSKINWIMSSLHINSEKIMYCGDHYTDIPIPIYAFQYNTWHFDLELSDGLSFDREDYIEVIFDYDNSPDLPDMDDQILYKNYKTCQGLFGRLYTNSA